jgi:hypothetical protein
MNNISDFIYSSGTDQADTKETLAQLMREALRIGTFGEVRVAIFTDGEFDASGYLDRHAAQETVQTSLRDAGAASLSVDLIEDMIQTRMGEVAIRGSGGTPEEALRALLAKLRTWDGS